MICQTRKDSQTKISMISFEEFKSLDIPSDVGIFYYEIKRKFQLTHEEAYRRTLEYAKNMDMLLVRLDFPVTMVHIDC